MNKLIKEFILNCENIDWFIFNSHLPWLKLDIEVPHQKMFEEAFKLKDSFIEYRESNSKGWKSICIHGISSDKIYDYTTYAEFKDRDQSLVPYKYTEIAEKCPETVKFLEKAFFNTPFFRVRFMILEPGGYIEPHTDMPKKTLAPINIALNNPDKCIFKMRGYGLVPFYSGDAFMLDTSNEHIVYNGSKEIRIHMIIHCNFLDLTSNQKDRWSDLANRSILKTLTNTKFL